MKKLSVLALALIGGLLLGAVSSQAQGKKKKGAAAPAVMTAPAMDYQGAIDRAYAKYKDLKEGKNADYIKELATVDPNIYGIAIVTTDGKVYTAGDITSMVSIQSVSKAFVMATNIENLGHQAIQDKIEVDATGQVFNSIPAVQ